MEREFRRDCLRRHIEVVGQERYKLGFLAFLDVNVCYYPGYVVDVVFTGHPDLLTIFHQSLFHAASRNDAFRADSCNRCQP